MNDGVPEIDMEQLAAAVMKLNDMSPCDGIMMTRDGKIKVGYRTDPDTLCELISADELARKLTAEDLASYTEKELRHWAMQMDPAPLVAKIRAAMQR